ncbi:MAG: DEAD/DEAH box helicase [Actinomycetota bacterium]
MASADPLAGFSPVVREWFTTTFAEATPPQAGGWPAISRGENVLITAPTGSGKTLAAFLAGIDRLVTDDVPDKERRCRILYISPLRALAVDVEKNLRAPLRGIALAAERMGIDVHEPVVGMRTGDTDQRERQRLVRHPPDLLITTPESLFLMLTSRARETLRGVQAVIIDEIHAVAATKRGSHLAVSLERLAELTEGPFQRIGLSATQRPLSEIATFLGGSEAPGRPRPVTIVDEGSRKTLEVEVVIPVEDMSSLGERDESLGGEASFEPPRKSIWPAIHPRLLELILAHRTTLVFCNSRRLAERLATRLNELHTDGENRAGESDGRSAPSGEELVKAHHGSLSREQRLTLEDDLKAGRLRALVATSSLELGIDMGAVDLVVQVESPGAVSRGLQRIGRAGHQVGAPSKGTIFPKHRGDLLEAAVVVRRMLDGEIEHMRYLRNPLDVLAQQIVAIASVEEWGVEDLLGLLRRSAPFAELSDEVAGSVLDLLAGRYPSEEFAELRPRIVWDRVDGRVRARDGAARLAVTNAGTIPDRGLFGVFLPDGKRVGELDEEMVYESRPGETFLLGATTWRIEDIGFDRVTVTPAPGQPGKMPFWHGDKPGRPLELGRAVGAFARELTDLDRPDALDRLAAEHGLDEWAAENLLEYLAEQRAATTALPDDRTIVVERFRDEIGDWRVCVLSPFGAQVHAPWAIALQARLEETYEQPVELLWSDDGIVIRLPEAYDTLPVEELLIDPDEITDLVVAQLPNTAMFASRFREVAGRALLLPRRRPGQRTPLWQQRQRAADLLRVAAKYPSFPMLLETTRECLQDVFDVPALAGLLRDLRSRKVKVVAVDTDHASPFAQSLLFGWIGAYMYEGDAPLAERRAAALALDRDLLNDLLGAEELRELIDPDVLAELELELQCLVEGRRARDVDEVHDLLRRLGDLSMAELAARCEPIDVDAAVQRLAEERRAILIGLGGEERWAAAEDAARFRDALGCALPVGLPAVFTEPVDDPLRELVARYARTHGPFLPGEIAARLAAPIERINGALARLSDEGRIVKGEFRPTGAEREWCDVDVLRVLRRRSLAALRHEVEPVEQSAFSRFLVSWQAADRSRRGGEALLDALDQLQGAAIPASVLESDVLPSRVPGYSPADLDALLAAGELLWTGGGAIGASDGRIRLAYRDHAPLLLPPVPEEAPSEEIHVRLREHLAERGASFWPDLLAASGVPDEGTVLEGLWDLVWAGEVTNDTFAPVRAVVGGARTSGKGRGRGRGGRPRPGRLTRLGPPAGAGRWSLVAPVLEPRPTPTELAHARALQLLERHGVLTREAALAEGVEGGFAGVYGILSALEERGQLRRGYFVAGLGAAQFALPGAVDRVRGHREPEEGADAVALAAVDPAQPYGAGLAWPDSAGRPSRSAGAYVVLVDGEAHAFLERGARSLVLFPGAAEDDRWILALQRLVKDGRLRQVEARKVDGEPWGDSPVTARLVDHGFQLGYQGPIFRG